MANQPDSMAKCRTTLESVAVLFALPFLSELKISWTFAAAPLHFKANGWSLSAFGATIGAATLCRVAMNALLTAFGDWLIAPMLMAAVAGGAVMRMAPEAMAAVILGIASGHITDTAQVQASLVYRWRMDDPAAQKRALRVQAFATVMGYSSGAVLGGALYEHAGFDACALLQVVILGTMAAITACLPVVHAAVAESWRRYRRASAPRARAAVQPASTASTAEVTASAADASEAEGAETPPLTLCGTTRCLLLPCSVIWLCDGANIFSYICEWTLFAVYFYDEFQWSSTLTGAAQSAGDLLAAAVLALSATPLWARLLRAKGVGGRSSRQVDRIILQPPWNIALFFFLYMLTFVMLAQPIFALSVLGQVRRTADRTGTREPASQAIAVKRREEKRPRVVASPRACADAPECRASKQYQADALQLFWRSSVLCVRAPRACLPSRAPADDPVRSSWGPSTSSRARPCTSATSCSATARCRSFGPSSSAAPSLSMCAWPPPPSFRSSSTSAPSTLRPSTSSPPSRACGAPSCCSTLPHACAATWRRALPMRSARCSTNGGMAMNVISAS